MFSSKKLLIFLVGFSLLTMPYIEARAISDPKDLRKPPELPAASSSSSSSPTPLPPMSPLPVIGEAENEAELRALQQVFQKPHPGTDENWNSSHEAREDDPEFREKMEAALRAQRSELNNRFQSWLRSKRSGVAEARVSDLNPLPFMRINGSQKLRNMDLIYDRDLFDDEDLHINLYNSNKKRLPRESQELLDLTTEEQERQDQLDAENLSQLSSRRLLELIKRLFPIVRSRRSVSDNEIDEDEDQKKMSEYEMDADLDMLVQMLLRRQALARRQAKGQRPSKRNQKAQNKAGAKLMNLLLAGVKAQEEENLNVDKWNQVLENL